MNVAPRGRTEAGDRVMDKIHSGRFATAVVAAQIAANLRRGDNFLMTNIDKLDLSSTAKLCGQVATELPEGWEMQVFIRPKQRAIAMCMNEGRAISIMPTKTRNRSLIEQVKELLNAAHAHESGI